MESIVLDEGKKELILDDAKEFMGSEKWYSERGLPYRRGYLFHGCPGSGKTSLVHALAGELNLDIYVINLSKKGLDDGGLSELVGDLPARSVALIEEIDAAFTRGVNRETETNKDGTSSSAGVTLSGLLASIDGIQASEGRLLFATTNKYFALDPALIRPGRLDVHLEFTYASQVQAEELFTRFFRSADEGAGKEKADVVVSEKPVKSSQQASSLKPVKLTAEERDRLAKEFARAIPDKEFPMAAIQGLLLNFKNRPAQVIDEVPGWVDNERRARLARERAIKLAEEKSKVVVVEETVPAEAVQQPSPPPEEIKADEADKFLD
ncbi:hypothetical protein M408DRAFT_325711 [Serendipita vermifera MAFF 305830]|uniref:AAA+ ATPase domain-containing protein n=1 Tax=Serendipita vermifera MAFF 305830 TaxID=933852 RepID=A0A0C2X877_SERVB|nr:hypothetical protein M408DRAFT_325711 [Serendipita vermifera MAFF 305830]